MLNSNVLLSFLALFHLSSQPLCVPAYEPFRRRTCWWGLMKKSCGAEPAVNFASMYDTPICSQINALVELFGTCNSTVIPTKCIDKVFHLVRGWEDVEARIEELPASVKAAG